MAAFHYQALNGAGQEVSGIIEVATRALAGTGLRERGLRPFELREVATPVAGRQSVFRHAPAVKPADLATFSRQLATLLSAGLPLLRALTVLTEQTGNPRLRAIVTAVSQDIQGGQSLSAALGRHREFSAIYINMVKAGEIGGVLEVVLDRLATFAEKDLELRTKIRGALTYPAIMGLVAVSVVVFLMIFVIPTFVTMFDDVGVSLPLPTRIVVGISNFLCGYWYLVAAAVAGGMQAFHRVRRTAAGRRQLDALALRLPVFGLLNRNVATARFARTFGTLLGAGVPILQALTIVRDVAGNTVVSDAVERVASAVTEGEGIARTLHDAQVFDPMVTHIMAVGEETGSLETMLDKLADQYEMIVDETVAALSSMLEPLMIVGMGGAVGLIVTALFFPMFSIVETFD
ncbi:MAG TPA: type II secretion system F family protein [bacterium]|nr:type II secretion system F family protein [bacterium]